MKTWLNSWNPDQRRKKLLEKGIRLHAQFQSDEALEIAERLIQEQDPAGYELAAQIHLDEDRPVEARDLLIPALNLFPDNWQLTTKLARAQADLGFYPEARLCLESLLNHPAARELTLYDLAHLHLQFHHPDLALSTLAQFPTPPIQIATADLASLTALAHFRHGNLGSAQQLTDEAISLYQQNNNGKTTVGQATAYALAAIFAAKDEKFRLASQCIAKADDLFPDLEITLLARRMKNSTLLPSGTLYTVLAEGRHRQDNPKGYLGFFTTLTIFTTSENFLLPIANERMADNESIVTISEILSTEPGSNDYEGIVSIRPGRTYFELEDPD